MPIAPGSRGKTQVVSLVQGLGKIQTPPFGLLNCLILQMVQSTRNKLCNAPAPKAKVHKHIAPRLNR